MDEDQTAMYLQRNFPQMFKYGDMGTGPVGWSQIVIQLTIEIYRTAKRLRDARRQALVYNRVLRRGLAGDISGLEWFYKKSRMIYRGDPVAEALLEAEYLPVPEPAPWPQVEQIKEKFGSLRYYVSGLPDGLDSAVNLAERLSEYTCQQCGAPGKTRDEGWITVLCDHHYEIRQSRRHSIQVQENQAKVAI